MTNEEILAFIELADKATPGPWFNSKGQSVYQTAHFTRDIWNICETYHDGSVDTPFIAASRTIAPELAKQVLQLRSQLSIAVEALEDVANDNNHYHCSECGEVQCDLIQTATEALKKIRGAE